MPDIHARLSASGAHRWLNCTPSIRIEEESGIKDNNSEYAREGTLAHSYAELMLSHLLKKIDDGKLRRGLRKIQLNDLYSPDMDEYVRQYVCIVMEAISEAKKNDDDAYFGIEERLDFSPWAVEGFGTGDCVIVSNGVIEIIDLKYGKGVPVDAENNPQMMLYALGAYNCFEFLYSDIERVKMTIVQPRINHTNSWELTKDELLDWGEKIVKPNALLAYTGDGEAKSGEWCRFCKAKPVCRAYNDKQLELVKLDFKEPDLLSDDEVAEVLRQVDEITRWATSVKEYAQNKAVSEGTKFKGFKLVEGRSNRKIIDPESVATTLIDSGFDANDLFEPRKMLGISKLEKLVGKKKLEEIVGDYIVKPSGAPTLVIEDDKRPEWNPVQSDFEAIN